MKQKIIQLTDVCKTYKNSEIEVQAVNHVDLEIEKGEFTAIVGPSGSGKTTMLNLIGGLDRPDCGSIFVANRDIATLSDKELTEFRLYYIGFIFQSYNLLPVLTVRENSEFVMQLQGRSFLETKMRVEYLLKEVGLFERIDALPSKLSGGQQQRVAVVRALAPKPTFILADEPTANLDSKSTELLLDIMYQLNQEEAMTFVFSTHDARVMKRAKRIITLEDGKIVSDERR